MKLNKWWQKFKRDHIVADIDQDGNVIPEKEDDGMYPVSYLTLQNPAQLTRAEQEKVFSSKVKPWASAMCSLCYGRGYTGYNITTKTLTPCQCVTTALAKELEQMTPEEDRKVDLILPKGM